MALWFKVGLSLAAGRGREPRRQRGRRQIKVWLGVDDEEYVGIVEAKLKKRSPQCFAYRAPRGDNFTPEAGAIELWPTVREPACCGCLRC